MVEVAGSKPAGPFPVVCLVAEERDERGEDEANDESHGEHTGGDKPAGANGCEVAHSGQATARSPRRWRQFLVRPQASTRAHVHTSQITRSSTESVVNMLHTTIGRVSVSSIGLPPFSSPGIRRSTTRVASFPVRSECSMETASESVVMPRQPGTISRVHPGAA